MQASFEGNILIVSAEPGLSEEQSTITITDWVKATTTDIYLTWLNGKVTNIQVDRI